MGGNDSSRTQTNVRACIWKTAGACGWELARRGGKMWKVRMPSFGKRDPLSQPWPSRAQSSLKHLQWSALAELDMVQWLKCLLSRTPVWADQFSIMIERKRRGVWNLHCNLEKKINIPIWEKGRCLFVIPQYWIIGWVALLYLGA